MDIGTESSMRLFGEIGKQVAISNAIVADLRVQQWFEKTRMLYAEGDEEGRWLPPGTKFEANISFNKGGTFNPNINVRLVRDKGGETEVLNSGRFRLGADFKIANFMGGELHTMPYWGLNLGPVKPVHEIGLQINLLNLDEIFGSPGIRMEGGKISR